MSSENLVATVNEVGKCYHLYERPQDRLKQFLWRGRRQFFREFWALRPLSFSLKRAECMGFMGRNGSGKSTLLQILAQTLTPTCGTLEVKGRVAALLELGAGFNPEFSGRENVYLNGAILGLSTAEVRQRFDEIVAFSEIGNFIDEPVKTYSSGMFVRLAFAVAVHIEPDILIVDEALSVGDAAFQYKCLRRIEELQNRGTSIVLVSHDTAVLKRFCHRAGWLHEGKLVSFGEAVAVANEYEDFCRQQMKIVTSAHDGSPSPETISSEKPKGAKAPQARVTKTQIVDGLGVPQNVFVMGNSISLKIEYEVEQAPDDGLVLGAAIFRKDDLYVCGVNSYLDKATIPAQSGIHQVTIDYPQLGLFPGSYYFKVGLFDKTATVRWDFLNLAAEFTITGPYRGEGVYLADHRWGVAN